MCYVCINHINATSEWSTERCTHLCHHHLSTKKYSREFKKKKIKSLEWKEKFLFKQHHTTDLRSVNFKSFTPLFLLLMDYKIGFVCTLLIILCNAFPDGAPPDTCKLEYQKKWGLRFEKLGVLSFNIIIFLWYCINYSCWVPP